jgi:glucose-1-phosphate thymidylyltransferase
MTQPDLHPRPPLQPQPCPQLEVIGLLPAGGQATRLAPLPVSKELYPIGFTAIAPDGTPRPKVVAHYLLEKMRRAGIRKAFFVLKPGKWDIPSYFGDGTWLDMHLGYLTVHVPHGVPYTLNQAYPFVQGALVALGFPDILFQPEDSYQQVLARQAATQADVVLGLFPTEQFQKAGMVDFDATGRVVQIIEKPQATNLRYMWAIAVWAPTFTQFLHDYLIEFNAKRQTPVRELPIGDVIQAAIDQGLRVEAEVFPKGTYLDIGTPNDLRRAVHDLSSFDHTS